MAVLAADASARPTLAAPDHDPHLWLESVDGADATAWSDAQSAATLARFADAAFAVERDRLHASLDRADRIAYVSRRGGHLYNLWKDAANPRGLWRRTTLDAYRAGEPAWELLLDLDALATAEGEDWVWHGATTLPPAHERALLALSRGGGDASVLREFDLVRRAFVPPGPADGGFALAECKGGADWLDPDTLLLSAALGEGMTTRAGYARTVRLWRRGEPVEAAKILFEAGFDTMSASGEPDRTAGAERLFFVERTGFFDAVIHLGDRSGPTVRLDLPSDARVDIQAGWLAVSPRIEWRTSEATYPSDAVLGIALDAFLAGDRRFAVLWSPGERQALQHLFWVAGRLVLSVLDALSPTFPVFTPGPAGWTASALGGLPALGVVSAWPFDTVAEESTGTLLVSAEDPITPSTLMMLELEAPAAPVVLRQAPSLFDSSGLIVSRHEAPSVDGERIPYLQVGPQAETGDAPVHLTGYGGFGISSLPYYQTVRGQLWLAEGGTSVVANIRGGGEFGTAWHEAGRREGKALSHEDFAAVAADLVARGVTRPGRIAAEGGSNGGLLIANMLTRFPERFGALFCTIPLIDMRRYTRLLAGASWIAEYGDPDDPDDWSFLGPISAYHAAAPGRPYPPILLATSRRDDRVHPGHARKMAAKLQALGYDAWFFENSAGGHGYGKDSRQIASFAALGNAFLRRSIGWDRQ